MREIPFARPLYGDEEIEAVTRVLRSLWVMQGPRVADFEESFRNHTGAPHACAVSNCTCALHLALGAVGTGFGDVVVTASHSYIATANAVRACGAEPAFVDIEPDGPNMDAADLSRCLEEDFEEHDDGLYFREVERIAVGDSPLARCAEPRGRLAAILVVHQAGVPADLARILPLARARGVPVVEDAACALGTEITLDGGTTWDPIGRPHGDAACFSFHPRKPITTGEGGMITAGRANLDAACRRGREHGASLSTLERHEDREPRGGDFVIAGFNFRMTDIQAAIGLVQMTRLKDLVERRRRIGQWYDAALGGLPGVDVPRYPAYARVNYQTYIARLADSAGVGDVMRRLKTHGVNTRPGIACIHRETPYAAAWAGRDLPRSRRAQEESILLPLHPAMTRDDVAYVVKQLDAALGSA